MNPRRAIIFTAAFAFVIGVAGPCSARKAGHFLPTGALDQARIDHTATRLSDGRVIVSGGFDVAPAEIYDPLIGAWQDTSDPGVARHFHTSTLLRNGKVLVAGGATPDTIPLASAQLYDAAADSWMPTGNL